MRRSVDPDPSSSTAGSPSTSAGQATSRSGLSRLVPAASLNRSWPSTGGGERTGTNPSPRGQGAGGGASRGTSQPTPGGAIPGAAVNGGPSVKRGASTSSPGTRT